MKVFRNIVSVSAMALVAVVGMTTAASAAPVFTVQMSSAPNAFGSPNWNGYVANGLNSLENGLGNVGGSRATNAAAYEVAGATINYSDVVVSNFNSWLGVANPSGAGAAEYGHRMHAGLRITSAGVNNRFTLEQLNFNMWSTDSSNSLAFSGNFVGLNYNGLTRYGIDYGGDGVKGGGDDTVFTTGNGTTLVNELVYIGVGNAFDASFELGPTNQDKLDSVFAYIASEGQFDVNCTYWLVSSDGSTVLGSGTDSVRIVPAPSAAVALGLGGLCAARRRRSR